MIRERLHLARTQQEPLTGIPERPSLSARLSSLCYDEDVSLAEIAEVLDGRTRLTLV